jgi:23S rRNA (guanosine2251-2'-O)-methyltransferase
VSAERRRRPSPNSSRGRGGAPARGRDLGGEQVEGRQAVRELLLAGRRPVRELFVNTEDGGLQDVVDLARAQRVVVTTVSRRVLDAQARTESPQGVLARAAPLPESDVDDLIRPDEGQPPFLVAVDGVTDPGNLGALLRCAEGAGATGVLIPRHRAVHVTPTVAKAAAGAIEYLPIAVVGGLPAALERAKQAGCWVIGLDDGADRSLFELEDFSDHGVVVV